MKSSIELADGQLQAVSGGADWYDRNEVAVKSTNPGPGRIHQNAKGTQMDFDKLQSSEFEEKLKSVKTSEELKALVQEEDLELSDEQLEAISGGYFTCEEVAWSDVCSFYDPDTFYWKSEGTAKP